MFIFFVKYGSRKKSVNYLISIQNIMDSSDCKEICKEWTKTTSNNNNTECDKICIEITKAAEKIKRDEEITEELEEIFIFQN
jgi:hypothetical protein